MARHNREAVGEDQHGHEYRIEYQPDWLHHVKVTRDLASGRQSTKTLFRNPEPAVQDPGAKVRTRIVSPKLGIDLRITVHDERGCARRISVNAVIPSGPEQGETVGFILTRKRHRPSTGSHP
jgi:hypothetical protein